MGWKNWNFLRFCKKGDISEKYIENCEKILKSFDENFKKTTYTILTH